MSQGRALEPEKGVAHWRQIGRYAYLSVEEAVERLKITNPETVAALRECAVGLGGGVFPANGGRDDAYWQGGATQSKVPGARSDEARVNDKQYRPGKRWWWDFSARIEGAFGVYCNLVIFVCRRSHYMRLYPVRDKSARTFLTCALESR
jgi:hypothetical protein